MSKYRYVIDYQSSFDYRTYQESHNTIFGLLFSLFRNRKYQIVLIKKDGAFALVVPRFNHDQEETNEKPNKTF